MEPTLFIQISMDEFKNIINESVMHCLGTFDFPLKEESDQILSRKEVANLLGICSSTLNRRMTNHDLPFKKVGRKVIFSKKEILKSIRLSNDSSKFKRKLKDKNGGARC